ncbi:MAG: hypothetical protein DI598_02410 [Pseudopedobacter saltans]|uniref:DUF4292 domain-containing protein n=1 Tax=Pseudopedobacter saltans TaxID=151895 RepID=A0A2W5H198_9SPHI|nr:MAG: hypothetical protein DI598_02410 [Pseudopedobacter saltans]
MKATLITVLALLFLQSLIVHPLLAQTNIAISAKPIVNKHDPEPELFQNSFLKKIDNISGVDILSKNIDAIGGINQLKSIQSLDFKGSLEISGMKFNFSERKEFPNLDYIALSIDKDTILRSVFDGKSGYNQEISGKKSLTDDEIKERNQDNLALFNQISYLDSSKKFHLTNISKDNAGDSAFYRLDIKTPSGKLISEFYDTTTFLLTKSIEKEKIDSDSTVTYKSFGNYRKINGVQFPYSIDIQKIQNGKEQNIAISIESVQINLPTE